MQKEDNMTEEERIKKEMDNIPYKVVVEPAPCSRTALVRDRFIDEIKAEMKEESSEKVDDATWDKIVQRMKERVRNKKYIQRLNNKNNQSFEALEKRVETLEKQHQDLIDNLRIFMVNEEEEHGKL